MAGVSGSELRAIASATEVVVDDDGAVATRIHLFPMGSHITRDGRGPYVLEDLAHASAVIAATRATLDGTDFMLDYDHLGEAAASAGTREAPAKASGWIKPATLAADQDGIWGEVEWTAAAAAAIAAREYRYTSPWFGFDKSNGRVTRLFNAALVNRPALDTRAVAAQLTGDQHMDLSKIAGALGLGADASEDAILAAIGTAKEKTATAATAPVALALGLAAAATVEEMAIAAAGAIAGRADFNRFVPRAEYDALRAKVEGANEDRATASVDAAITAGKITPASREWALGYVKADPAGFANFLGVAPAIVSEGQGTAASKVVVENTLSEKDKSTARLLNISDAEWLASKKELAA
ncbi:phage protease [Sphingomonas naphthae]|uniref:Phage protease n=1 Tax=Sphingomonas naphthae TaxID=1813468 RepID=A0ABY7TFS3_9SPHN|nr:phage protease [Sphingomonas naphthae]WCT72063.1 phage protease [Sphingomonas naphthae]